MDTCGLSGAFDTCSSWASSQEYNLQYIKEAQKQKRVG